MYPPPAARPFQIPEPLSAQRGRWSPSEHGFRPQKFPVLARLRMSSVSGTPGRLLISGEEGDRRPAAGLATIDGDFAADEAHPLFAAATGDGTARKHSEQMYN